MTRSEPDYEVVALRRALDECRQHHADTVAGLDPHTGPAATEEPGLDVERLAIAINGGPDDLDQDREWYLSPRRFAQGVAKDYAALSATEATDPG